MYTLIFCKYLGKDHFKKKSVYKLIHGYWFDFNLFKNENQYKRLLFFRWKTISFI